MIAVTEIVVTVPAQAPSFLIVVRTPKGDAMSLVPFSVEKALPPAAKK